MSNMTDAIKNLTVAIYGTHSDGIQTTKSKMLRQIRILASKNVSKWFSVKHLCTKLPENNTEQTTEDEWITEPGNFISISSCL